MARTRAPDDLELARVTARVLRDGAQALYREPQLYDRLYQRRRRDVAFYVRTAERYGGPVLELGAGNGRVTLALARAGIEVVGVDAMSSMLRASKIRLARLPAATAARVTMLRGDLRSVRLRRRFPLVIAPFNGFLHLYDRADIERGLATCRQHLTARGRLVLDVSMPDLRALLQDPERLYACPPLRHPADGQRYRLLEASHYDPILQIRSMTMVFESVDRPGQRSAIPLAHRQLFPAELEALLHYNGFVLEARYGDFDEGPLGPESAVQIVVARRRTRR